MEIKLYVYFSVIPKCNNELMNHCYAWVRQMPNVLKCNNWSSIHCYVWVRQMPIVPKCNTWSLIHCYVWVWQMPIVPKLHVYQKNIAPDVNKSFRSKILETNRYTENCQKWKLYRAVKTLTHKYDRRKLPSKQYFSLLFPPPQKI